MQAQAVRRLHEMLQVVQRAELRVDAVGVLDRLGAAQAALAVLLADGGTGISQRTSTPNSFSRGRCASAARNVPSGVNCRVLIRTMAPFRLYSGCWMCTSGAGW